MYRRDVAGRFNRDDTVSVRIPLILISHSSRS
jgi:hypothetical protein